MKRWLAYLAVAAVIFAVVESPRELGGAVRNAVVLLAQAGESFGVFLGALS